MASAPARSLTINEGRIAIWADLFPFIRARHGAIPKVLGEGEILFTPGDVLDFREKIAAALDNLTRL